jgi:RHS repeat-associated protein
VLLAEDGREIEFDTFDLPEHRIAAGQSIYNPIERLTLHCETGGWIVVDHRGMIREFAEVPGGEPGHAMIQRVRSRCGFHEITFHYGTEGTARGRLEWVRDSGGRLVHLRHDEQGRVVALYLPQPQGEGFFQHRSYVYDAEGDLVEVVDALGHAWQLAYVSHLLARETDRNGQSFYFAYDGVGEDAWCVRTWGDGGIHDHVLSYDKRGRATFVTDSLGHTTQYHMNPIGQVVKVVDSLGAITQYEYDPVTLRRTAAIDPLGHATRHAYDGRGNGTWTQLASGAELRFEYDDRGQLVAATDAGAGRWTWQYDSHGRLVSRCAADGSEQRFAYEGARLRSILDPDGRSVELGYDTRGCVERLRTADGATTTWQHDALGRKVQLTDPLGNVIRFRHDLAGRPIAVHEPDGNVRVLELDREGRPLRAKDALREATFAYSATGRLRSRSEAGTTVQYQYDTEERLVAVVNAEGRVHAFELDPCGQVIAESCFDGTRRTIRRDKARRPTEFVRTRGSITHRYDPMGRIVEVLDSDGGCETFEYGADGMLLAASNGATTIRFERDALGRVSCEWQGDHWVRSAYDLAGRRAALRSSLGALQAIERDGRGDPTALRWWNTTDAPERGPASTPDWSIAIERDLLGFEVERRLPGGVSSRWTRDTLGRPLQHTLAARGDVLRDAHYQWSLDDRLQQLADPQRGLQVTYAHDVVGNLAWAQYGEEGGECRMPDALGNLYRRSDRSDRKYGACGEVLMVATRAGTRRYEYDDEGNLVARHEPDGGVWRFAWSLSGRLMAVERPDGSKVEFEYDPLGRRIRKHFEGRTTHWLWDGNVPIHEWQTARVAVAAPPERVVTWVFEPETFIPAAKLTAEQRLSIVTDHIGAPISMVDAEGREVWRGQLDIYGKLRMDAGAPGEPQDCPFRWPGQYEDVETGLHYNRYRYYDPDAGHYVSRDPIGLAGDLSPHRYVADPLRFVDPLGLMPWAWNPDTGMGHHLVPRGKANSAGMPLLGTDRHTPTFFPNPYNPGDHEAIHRAQRPDVGPLQGPWTGTPDELLEASRRGLDDIAHMRGDLKIPATGEVLAKNVTPAEAFDELMKWHDAEKKKATTSCT